MVIKILGPGCMNCQRLEEHARQAVERLGIQADIVKVQDLSDIVSYGVMATPGLVVDEDVKVAGRVPSVDELADMLRPAD